MPAAVIIKEDIRVLSSSVKFTITASPNVGEVGINDDLLNLLAAQMMEVTLPLTS